MSFIDITYQVLTAVDYILLSYFAISAIYFLLFALFGLLYYEKKKNTPTENSSYLILIPAYREDSVIYNTAKAASEHKSKHSYEVTVIADSLSSETITKLKTLAINLEVVDFEKSTKVKALNIALANATKQFDYALILDADNVMSENFLDELNLRIKQGFRVVQGHRTAMNDNTSMAILDGLSEEINNNIFRKGHRSIGLSAAIIGSGFACEFNLFKQTMLNMNAVGGFDKELEVALLSNKIKVGYAHQAIIYDEKVQQDKDFTNQRRRWISAQIVYLKKHIFTAFKKLILHANIDLFNKVLQFALPPRILTLGFLVFGASIHLVIMLLTDNSIALNLSISWSTVLVFSILALVLSIPRRLYKLNLIKAILRLPAAFMLTLLSAIKIRGVNKQFLHTQHGVKK